MSSHCDVSLPCVLAKASVVLYLDFVADNHRPREGPSGHNPRRGQHQASKASENETTVKSTAMSAYGRILITTIPAVRKARPRSRTRRRSCQNERGGLFVIATRGWLFRYFSRRWFTPHTQRRAQLVDDCFLSFETGAINAERTYAVERTHLDTGVCV